MATPNMLPEGWEYDEEPATTLPDGWELEEPLASATPTLAPTAAPDVGGSWRPGMERESAGGLTPASMQNWQPELAKLSAKTTYDPKTVLSPGEDTWGQTIAKVAVPMGAAMAGTASIMALAPSAPLWGAMAMGSVGGDVIGRWLTNQPQSLRDEVFNGLTAALGGADIAKRFMQGGMRLTGVQLSRVKQALGRIATAAGMGGGAMYAANELTGTPHKAGDYAVGTLGEGIGEGIGMGLRTMMTPATTARVTDAARRLGLGNDQIADIFTAPEGSAKREILRWLSSTGAGATNAQLDEALRAVTRTVNTRFPQVPLAEGNLLIGDMRQGLENSIGQMSANFDIANPATPAGRAVNTALPPTTRTDQDFLMPLNERIRAQGATAAEAEAKRIVGVAAPGVTPDAAGFSTAPINVGENARKKIGGQYGAAAKAIDTALGGTPVTPTNFAQIARDQLDEIMSTLAPEHPFLARARKLRYPLTDPNRAMSAEEMVAMIKELRAAVRASQGTVKNLGVELEQAARNDLATAVSGNPGAEQALNKFGEVSKDYRNAINASEAIQGGVRGSLLEPGSTAKAVEKATSEMTPETRLGMESAADAVRLNPDIALSASVRNLDTLNTLYTAAKGGASNPSNPLLMQYIRQDPALENEMIRRFVSEAAGRRATPGTGAISQTLFGEGLREAMQNPVNTSFLNNLSPNGRQRLADLMDNAALVRPPRMDQAQRAVGMLEGSTDPYQTMANLTQSRSGIPADTLTSTPVLANPAGAGRQTAQNLMVQGGLPNLRATGDVDVTELAEFTRSLREPSINPRTPSADQITQLATAQGTQDLRDLGDVGQALASALEAMPAEYNATIMNRIRNISSQVSTSNVMQSGIGIPTGIARTGGALMMVLGASQIPAMMRALITSNFAPATVQAAEAAGRSFLKALQQRALQERKQ